ncbi:hypothetical protein [Aliikangiella coralliicola]|uniref:Uncharacterized protein n=1 Tax=Aliikangiella coralliicola TaxID=2592383 RepID=A0A545U8P6_9GAMM|nr:hypothetical protein [Aliikangiella coralliicola]TQV85841.1 hypothetical protein FLL46_18110 [Aliikangiella coralliicola]
MKKYLFLGILLVLSSDCFAGTWTNGQQLVKHVIWRPGYHGFYVDSSKFHDPEGCRTTGTANMYLIDQTWETQNEKTVDRLYSAILLAFSTGKKVHVFVDGCIGQIPKMTGIQINP